MVFDKRIPLLIIIILMTEVLSFAGNGDFWNIQKKGANCFNKIPTEQWFIDARNLGLEWVRITYDKWDSEHRDFLIGDVSNYNSLIKKDLDKLKEVISWADKYDIKLVITPLSLPGTRYRQNNNNKPDTRLWKDFAYWHQAIRFWIDLSKELKDFDIIVAYNIINEPSPELGAGVEEHYHPGEVPSSLIGTKKFRVHLGTFINSTQ